MQNLILLYSCYINCIQFPDDDIKVIFMNTHSSIARLIVCEVGHILVHAVKLY